MGIILASASPRRERLLRKFAKGLKAVPAHIDERIHKNESFAHACVRLAKRKAMSVARRKKGAAVVGADTIAYMGRENYRKTSDKKTAARILRELSGKTHHVITGVAVVLPSGRCISYSVKAAVRMKKLDEKTIAGYLETDDWKGRAGSYDLSGKGKALVASVKGERETVVGLPVKRLRPIVKRLAF